MPFNLGPRTAIALTYVLVATSSLLFHNQFGGPSPEEDLRLVDFKQQTTTTTTTSTSSTSTTQLTWRDITTNIVASQSELDRVLEIIIQKWDLSEDAKPYLKKIWYKDNSYNRSSDLVVFHHPMKTGGSSVSDVLEQLGGLVPGSDRSGKFGFNKWRKKYEKDVLKAHKQAQEAGLPPPKRNQTIPEWFDQFRVLYSHSYYRNYPWADDHGNDNRPTTESEVTGIYKVLKYNAPRKRIRHITMVREPLAFTASNFNEWFCRLNRLGKLAIEYKIPNDNTLTESSDPPGCDGYTLHHLTQARWRDNEKRCLNKTEAEYNGMKKNPTYKKICKTLRDKGLKDDQPECASIENFMRSKKYTSMFHNHETYARTTYKPSPNRTKADYAHGALEYLGGIDAFYQDGMGSSHTYGDMMWFGVTERMKESMCLLHYQLELPTIETPQSRVQACRPTNYWSKRNKQQFYAREQMMVAVHHAANAVLDLQVAKMQHHVGMTLLKQQQDQRQRRRKQQQKHGGQSHTHINLPNVATALESMPWINSRCLDPTLWKGDSDGDDNDKDNKRRR